MPAREALRPNPAWAGAHHFAGTWIGAFGEVWRAGQVFATKQED